MARTRGTFVVADVQGAQVPRVQGRTGAAKVTKTIFACAFTGKPDRFPHGLGRLSGSLEGASDLHGWRKCKGIVGNNPCLPLRVDARLGCVPLSLLSLASPGLAIRGEPAQQDKGPLDLCLDPLHPSRPLTVSARCTGTYKCRERRTHASGLGSA